MATSYTYTTREIEKMLRKKGYEHVRTRGGHKIYSNGMCSVAVTSKINKMVALRIIKDCQLEACK